MERNETSKYFFVLIYMLAMTINACTGIPYISKGYGEHVVYGEGKHPGIDFEIPVGTPIIAASDGSVAWIGDPCGGERWCGDRTVWIGHGDFYSGYSHLRKVLVKRHQIVKRGQLIGLSGASNNGFAHLHFGLIKIGGMGRYYSNTYNPGDFWLDGKMQCFDPNKDYSAYDQGDLTLPVACGEYRKALRTE